MPGVVINYNKRFSRQIDTKIKRWIINYSRTAEINYCFDQSTCTHCMDMLYYNNKLYNLYDTPRTDNDNISWYFCVII